jgi:hypothetical protein
MNQVNKYDDPKIKSYFSPKEIDRRRNLVNELKNTFEEIKFKEEESNSYQNVKAIFLVI